MQGSVTVVVGLETELYLGEGNGRCLFKICASGGKGGGGKIWVSAKNLRSRGRVGSEKWRWVKMLRGAGVG